MSAGPQDLYAFAQEVLEAAIEGLDNIPNSAPGLEGAPERAFVSAGQPAIDCCPQLTVHVASVDDTMPGVLNPGQRKAKKNYVRVIVTIVRCVIDTRTGVSPVLHDVPLVADLEATAEQVDADGWALWNHFYNLYRADDLFSLCGEVFFEGLRSMTESGTCSGWTLTLRVSLDGYDNAESS